MVSLVLVGAAKQKHFKKQSECFQSFSLVTVWSLWFWLGPTRQKHNYKQNKLFQPFSLAKALLNNKVNVSNHFPWFCCGLFGFDWGSQGREPRYLLLIHISFSPNKGRRTKSGSDFACKELGLKFAPLGCHAKYLGLGT